MNRIIQTVAIVIPLISMPMVKAQKTEIIPLESVKNIEIIGKIGVNLITSNDEGMELFYDGIERDKISIEQENGTLKIKIISTLSYKDVDIMIDLKFKELEKIGAYSSAMIVSDETITQDSLFIEAEGGGEVALKLFLENLRCNAGTSGVITLSGLATNHQARINTGASLSAAALKCENYDLSVNTKGVAKVFVTENLKCRATTGGYVSYKGDPNKREISKNIGAKVEVMVEND